MNRLTRGRRRSRGRRLLALAVAGVGVAAVGHRSAWAADTELDVLNGGATDLTSAATYSQNTSPTTTSDVTFNITYNPTAFTVNSNLSIGTLNDLAATQALTITNTGTTATTLTLSTAADSVSGSSTTDLLYVANGDSLTIANGSSAAFGLALGATGTFDVAGTATIGAGISGAYSLTKTGAGTLTLTGGNTYTGSTVVANGVLNVAGAASIGSTASLPTGLLVGNTAGQTGVLNITTSGTLYFNNATNGNNAIGGTGTASTAVGVVNQSSGTVDIIGTAGNYLEIGYGGSGTYNLGGTGNLSIPASTSSPGIRLADIGGTGVFTQTGGTLVVGRYFAVGANSGSTTGAVGVATFTGGTASLGNGPSTYRVLLGDGVSCTGIMNLGTEAGGNAVVTAYSTGVSLAANSGATGILNLNAGVLAFPTGGIFNNTSGVTASVLNLNGGTVRATASGYSVIGTGLTTANVYNGGATIDNGSFTTTAAASLLGTIGNGIYETGGTIAVAGPAVAGTPVVTVVGGGTGATAIANVSGGVVTGVTLTNPGQNYAVGQVLTFNLSGGGLASTTSINYTLAAADLKANGTGGLTAVGTGTTYLTGSNTYTGPTVVSAGVLYLGSSTTTGTINNTSAISVAAGAAIGNGLSVANTLPQPITGAGGFIQGIAGYTTIGTTTALTNNTYTGPTNIVSGILIVPALALGGQTSSIGASSNASSNLVVGSSFNGIAAAQFQYTGGTFTTDRGITFANSGDSIFNVASASTVLTLGGQVLGTGSGQTAVEGAGTLVIANTASTNTLGGAGGLYVADGGLVLNGTNVINGTLRVGNNGPSSEFTNVINAFMNVASGTTTDTGSFYMAENNGVGHTETVNVQAGATLSIAGSGTFRTGYSNAANGSGPSVINVSGGATFVGGNTMTLSAVVNNQNAVDTTLNIGDGTTANGPGLFNTAGIVTGSGTSVINFNNGTLQANANASGGALLTVSSTQTVNILAGGMTVDTQAYNVSISAPLLTGVTGGNDGGLTKIGTGTLTLTAASVYTGGTNVSAGTLRANSTAATGTNTVTVNSGGTLGGSGSTAAVVVNKGGTITAGPDNLTTGTLTTAGQSWTAGGGYLAKVNPTGTATTNDELVMSGLTISATTANPFTVTAASLNTSNTAAAGTPLVLALDTNTAQTGVFATAITAKTLVLSTSSTAAFSSGTPTLAEVDVSGTGEELVLTAAPEPTSCLLLAGVIAPLAVGRRRRRRDRVAAV